MKRISPSAWALALLLISSGLAVQAAEPAAAEDGGARVIVRFKPGADSVRAKAMHRRMLRSEAMDIAQNRANALGLRTGRALRARLNLDERTQVITAAGMDSATLARRLAQDSEVELVAIDQRRRHTVLANDPFYASGNGAAGPASGQWYLKPPAGEVVSSINAPGAWDYTKGASSIVVAVLDTGVRKDHPDLAGQFVGGYDMVSSASNTILAVSNDGDRADADASDPGDWVTQAEINAGTLGSDCTSDDVGGSSWHGTRVSGLVAANTNNGLGIAGIGWNVKILPVRVLGKCGGYDSDIIAGMKWAAGISVPGLPDNPNPAKVLNMSLGGDGSCSTDPLINTNALQRQTAQFYRDVITQVTARGATIVASAGNTTGEAVGVPGNCPGVIAVAGLRHAGSKVGFSSLGPEVAIAAPGGNCVNIDGGPCLYPMLSTTNRGTTTPLAADDAYTNGAASVGTSFSAPLVSGTVALMYSLKPTLTPAEVKTILQSTARPFITSGATAGTPQCHAPNNVEQLECYCTTSTCGAGMLDAAAAVRAVAATVADSITLTSSPSGATAGQTVTVSAEGSTLAAGRTIAAIAWVLVDGGGAVSGFSSATNAMTAALAPTAAGTITVRVQFTDELGGTHSSNNFVIAVAAAPVVTPPVAPAATSGGGGGGAFSALWLALLGLACVALRPARAR